MQAEKDKVVSFHYQLSEESGAEVESSQGREPMAFLYGHGGIIPTDPARPSMARGRQNRKPSARDL